MTESHQPESAGQSLPTHIETTLRAIADLQARHQRKATPSQRAFAVMAGFMARPRFIGVLTFVLAGWIFTNLLVRRLGFTPWDPPPFSWLQGMVAVAALYTTATILIAQKREDEFSSLREQLTLELALLGEQKSAKTIELLERLRRDLPSAPNRVDPEAAAMARPADPISVADAIIEKHEAAVLEATEASAEEAGS